jgi:cobalt/nickel transport system permease protein
VAGFCNHGLGGIGLAGDPASPIHRLDPRAKIVGFLGLTIVAVSTPLSDWPVYVACAAVLAVVAVLARVHPREIWRRSRAVLPLVLFVAVFLPFVRHGGETYGIGPVSVSEDGLRTFAEVASKATLGTVSAVLLGATTAFPAVLRGLERLRVPRVLTLIAAFMYRYLFVIVDEVQRMRAALVSRAYRPRHLLHTSAIGRVATALFLRTYTRSERVYLAMAARGYRGSMPELVGLHFGRVDAVFVAGMAIVLLGARALVEVY